MIAILVGAIALFVFGAIWFTVLFGKMWSRMMNFTPEEMSSGKQAGMVKPLIFNFLLNILIASVIAYLYPHLLTGSFSNFLKSILIIWLGFSFPIYANQALWEKKSWGLVLLNSAQGILSFSIISAIIYFWQ